MKIHIFYNHYNIENTDNRNRPHWFNYEKCFVNLLNTIKNKNVELHLVMDGKIEDNWIKKYKKHYISHEIVGGSMESITLGVYNIAKLTKAEDTDLIYILENDYLHDSIWVDKIVNIFRSFEGLSYVSLYDALDKYFAPMYDNLVSKVYVTSMSHWRSTPSTCGSYVTTKKIFDEDYSTHIGIDIPIGDHHKWLHLNSNKDRFIITPIPGLSTHCVNGLLSPIINWEKINNETKYE